MLIALLATLPESKFVYFGLLSALQFFDSNRFCRHLSFDNFAEQLVFVQRYIQFDLLSSWSSNVIQSTVDWEASDF